MRAEFFRRFDKTEFTRAAKVILRMLNQQLYHLRRQLHMALETVNPFAVLHDLAGTALAVSQNLSLRRQPRHVVMPVTDVQHAAKALKQMGVQKLPDITALKKEMDSLTAEKQQEYGTYQKIKVQVKELDTIKRNVDQFLSAPQKEEREKNKERG